MALGLGLAQDRPLLDGPSTLTTVHFRPDSELRSGCSKNVFRMIPVGNDVTRLVLLRDELYEATDVTFELNCDIRLCLMTEKDSICSEEVYDTSLCDKVTY